VLHHKLGDRYAEASFLAHVGACHHLAGDDAAADAFRQRVTPRSG
jgi:hypothetical protein